MKHAIRILVLLAIALFQAFTATAQVPWTINVGTTANDGTGDTLRRMGQKVNSNFLAAVTGAGTAGYVPKYTGTNVIGNSIIAETATGIGINTASPQSKAHIVSGNNDGIRLDLTSGYSAIGFGGMTKASAANPIIFSDNSYLALAAKDGNPLYLFADSVSSSSTINMFNGKVVVKHDGSVGIGTPSPTAVLHLKESSAVATALNIANRNGTRTWSLASDAVSVDDGKFALIESTVSAIRFVVDTAGQVGIGTASPGKALDVTGDIRCSSQLIVGSTTTAHDILPETANIYDIGSGAAPFRFGNFQSNIIVGGTVIFTNGVWDDLQIPGLTVKTGGTAPTIGSFVDATFQAYLFAGAATDDQVWFSAQLPHSYKQGSDIIPHVHWAPTATTGAGTNVVWELHYSWKNINEAFDSGSTITVTNGVNSTNWVHQITNFAPISGSGKTVSSVLMCRLRRLASSNASDDYNQPAAFIQFDFHFQKDTVGSLNSTSK